MKRRWFQFRLRTLLGVMTLVAVSTGLLVQHVRFVQQRIRYHEERLANCELRIVMREDPVWLNDRWQSATTDIDPYLPEGHLLFNPPTSLRSKRKDLWTIMQEVDRETAVLGASKSYHQGQIQQYRESLWRPWNRVQETSDEILDLPPEILPELPESPTNRPLKSNSKNLAIQRAFLVSELKMLDKQRADLESNSLNPKPEARSPWRSIDRPLPFDFDQRDVQIERAANA